MEPGATSLREPAPGPADAGTEADEGDRVRLLGAGDRWWVTVPLVVSVVVLATAWQGVFRPLWYDEAWRGYHVTLTSGFFSSLRTANAPMAAGWLLLERLSTAIFGNVEWALRLPSVVSLVVFSVATYRLARWWLPPAWSAATASLATINTSLLVYGLQAKSYLPEAACTSLILCAWLTARERRATGRRAVGPWVLIVACALVSLPAVLVIGPLVVYEIVEAARHRAASVRSLAAPVIVGGIAGVHLLTFVVRQSYLTHNSFWRPVALSGPIHVKLHHLWTAIVSFPAGVVTAGYTSPDGQAGSPFRSVPLDFAPTRDIHVVIAIGCVALWIAGVIACTRRRGGAVVLVALGGSMAAATVAATRMEWPIGFVRANLFAVPMLYVVAAIGLHSMIEKAAPHRIWFRPVIAVSVVWCLAVAGTGVWRLTQLHDETTQPLLLGRMRTIAAEERRVAVPGDRFVVVVRRDDVGQWIKAYDYYSRLSDRTKLPFASPPGNELALTAPASDKTLAFLARAHPRHVFVVVYGVADDPTNPAILDQELAILERAGYCPASRTSYLALTGTLTILKAC